MVICSLHFLDKFNKNWYSLFMLEREYMNNNVDVLRELAVKNKEIYLNKLSIDLDNNEENTLITIENIISLFTKEVTDKVLEIENNMLLSHEASKEVSSFYKIIHEEIKKSVKKRNDAIREKIKKIEDNNYREVLNDETNELVNRIQKAYLDNVDKLINDLTKKANVFTEKRINDYLKNLNYDRFINKIKESITNLDVILYNNYLESERKYNELNKKVIN